MWSVVPHPTQYMSLQCHHSRQITITGPLIALIWLAFSLVHLYNVIEIRPCDWLPTQVAPYTTTLCGLFLHALVLLPLIFFIITRKNLYRFLKGVSDALMTAFGIASRLVLNLSFFFFLLRILLLLRLELASFFHWLDHTPKSWRNLLPSVFLSKLIVVVFNFSAATLPTTIRCVEENNHIDPRISRFMLPLGATLNMDGVSIARVVTTIFIAQLNNIPLSLGRVVVIWWVKCQL